MENAAEAARGDALLLGRGLRLGRPLESSLQRFTLGELGSAKPPGVFVPVVSDVYSGIHESNDPAEFIVYRINSPRDLFHSINTIGNVETVLDVFESVERG
ncbi:MAG: hypothetical protein CMK83_01340 [Pseudomonadales bacterium]|nr:hypothetical protein [Pseudomonadales bacterium]